MKEGVVRVGTILVPTDFSENAQRAFEVAYDLARQCGAGLHVLHVQDEGTLRTAVKENLLTPESTDEQLSQAVGELIEGRISTMLAGLDRSEVNIVRAFRRGVPASVVIGYAAEVKADLVVVGLRGVGLTEKIRAAVVGSVADNVIMKSPCPVVVVRIDHGKR